MSSGSVAEGGLYAAIYQPTSEYGADGIIQEPLLSRPSEYGSESEGRPNTLPMLTSRPCCGSTKPTGIKLDGITGPVEASWLCATGKLDSHSAHEPTHCNCNYVTYLPLYASAVEL